MYIDLASEAIRRCKACWSTYHHRCGSRPDCCLFLTACEKPPAPPAPGPPDVEVTEVIQQNVPIFREWVAQLNGPINAAITPKVQGYLLTQNYNNGFFVKKGRSVYY